VKDLHTQITTLKKPDGSFTADTKETVGLMMETFTFEDNKMDDNEYHKQVVAQALLLTDVADDRKFTMDEV
jgi:DICT domain-containing protein